MLQQNETDLTASATTDASPQWIPELQQYAKGIPFVLVASKTDLRNDQTALTALAAHGRASWLVNGAAGHRLWPPLCRTMSFHTAPTGPRVWLLCQCAVC